MSWSWQQPDNTENTEKLSHKILTQTSVIFMLLEDFIGYHYIERSCNTYNANGNYEQSNTRDDLKFLLTSRALTSEENQVETI